MRGDLMPMLSGFNTADFKNEHGEEFTIYSNGVMVFISGNEIDAMVDQQYKSQDGILQLFNEWFSIWNPEDLYLLGKALQEVSGYKEEK